MDSRRTMMELQQVLREAEELINQLLKEDYVGDLKPETSTSIDKEESDKKLFLTIAEYLKRFGIPTYLRGYNYLKTAIQIIYENKSRPILMTRELYPEIARMYGTKPSRVERTIRHAIRRGNEKGNKKEYEKMFPYLENSIPTNSEFINMVVEDMKMSL